MTSATVQWRKASDEKPGFTIFHADGPDGHYVIQRNRNSEVRTWRLAHRTGDTDPLRIIYIGNTLKDCQEYAHRRMETA